MTTDLAFVNLQTFGVGATFFKHLKLLFVDDNESDLVFYGQHIAQCCNTFFAKGTEECRTLLAKGTRPDIIILDLHIARDNGLTFLEELRSTFPLEHTRIIILSSEEATHWKVETFTAGAHDYIQKTVSIDEFISRIKYHLIEAFRYKMLLNAAYYCSLTKVPNRNTLNIELQNAFNACKREKDWLSFLMIDIDYFKQYNDEHSHQEGDKMLLKVAQIIRSFAVRSRDIAARFGGEEFSLILPKCNVSAAKYIAEALRNAVEKRTAGKITVSIGICSIDFSSIDDVAGIDKTTLVKNADQALYVAKNNGRNQVQLYQ